MKGLCKRAIRRSRTERIINRRKTLAKAYGLQQGTLYSQKREKIENSYGYIRDGNVSHYICVGHIHSCHKGMSLKDKKRIVSMEYDLRENIY